MTDRLHSLVVVLDKDVRTDDAQGLIDAIGHMRGVLSVTGNVSDFETHMAEQRARAALGDKILDVIYPERIANRGERD